VVLVILNILNTRLLSNLRLPVNVHLVRCGHFGHVEKVAVTPFDL